MCLIVREQAKLILMTLSDKEVWECALPSDHFVVNTVLYWMALDKIVSRT